MTQLEQTPLAACPPIPEPSHAFLPDTRPGYTRPQPSCASYEPASGL